MNRLARAHVALFCFAAAVFFAAPGAAQAPERPPLSVEVLQTSAGSLNANIALIMGEQKAVLVDAPFTRADAFRVAAMVLDSGKQLETIFITHDHPDHFFAMEVLADVFPNARIVAHPIVVADIWRSLPFKVRRWSPMLGANGPRHPSAPLPLEGDTIMLEGRELRVIGPMQGDHVHATALYAPSIRALFAGDLLFDEMYLWLGEHGRAETRAWRRSIDTLAALQAEMIVPGHSKPGMTRYDASGLDYTRRYLDFWLDASRRARNSEDLMARVRAAFPDSIDALNDFILPNSAKIAMGEAPRWEE